MSCHSNTTGGTLTLPSPTSVHHVDVRAAVRSLRRSLSRSPSKFLLRSSSGSSNSSPHSSSNPPHSPSPQPPLPSHNHQETLFGPTSHTSFAASGNSLFQQPQQIPSQPQQPVVTPYRPKLSLRSARPKAQSAKPLARTRPSPRSPLKRALSSSNDAGNAFATAFAPTNRIAAPVPPATSPSTQSSDQENRFNSFALAFGQAARSTLGTAGSRHSMHLDLSGASKAAYTPGSRFLEKSPTYPPTTTPLKRTDPSMTTDAFGSPVAKRRSLHGIASFGAGDLAFLAQASPSPRSGFEIHEDADQEYKLTGVSSSIATASREPLLASPSTSNVSVPKRTSSLRKSTLQQRHDPRSSWGKRQGEKFLAQQSHEPAQSPVQRSRHQRASLDQFINTEPRESPFASRGPLLNPSAHFFDRQSHQPHPLSRTYTTASMTTSSSSSSVADESPSHPPAPAPERHRSALNFSRSLPVGAHRPTESVATPSYKEARPLQSAFASTGLVSKMNRNPELGQSQRGGPIMPDTPCKKQFSFNSSINYPHATFPPSSGSSRKQRSSLGTNNGYLDSSVPLPKLGDLGSSNRNTGGLFKGRGGNRKSCFFDSDFDLQMLNDDDMPPTPTKQALVTGKSASAGALSTTPAGSRSTAPSTSVFGRRVGRPSAESGSSPLQRLGPTSAEPPKTPRDEFVPPDASLLSISNARGKHTPGHPPATPTTAGGRISVLNVNAHNAITPVNVHGFRDVDLSLVERFSKVDLVGMGEFSQVFRVEVGSTTPGNYATQVYAVKKLRHQYMGIRDREKKLREVSILRALQGGDNILRYVDSWEEESRLYIQTEFCEEGSLRHFLREAGEGGRLDDFRIWKILLEISQGLNHIHESGFMHLDIKPANVLVAFDGTLKIGDFGLASSWPAPKHIDGEGDREYMAPEVLLGIYDKSADVFALGLMTLEMSTNSNLPDNGDTWIALREGDMSPCDPCTSVAAQSIKRDDTGLPIRSEPAFYRNVIAGLDLNSNKEGIPLNLDRPTHDPSNLFRSSPKQIVNSAKQAPTAAPQDFMVDPNHPGSLENIVQWMIQPEPSNRATVRQILNFSSVSWVSSVRQAPATVFEGNWGPAEKVTTSAKECEENAGTADVEMTDV